MQGIEIPREMAIKIGHGWSQCVASSPPLFAVLESWRYWTWLVVTGEFKYDFSCRYTNSQEHVEHICVRSTARHVRDGGKLRHFDKGQSGGRMGHGWRMDASLFQKNLKISQAISRLWSEDRETMRKLPNHVYCRYVSWIVSSSISSHLRRPRWADWFVRFVRRHFTERFHQGLFTRMDDMFPYENVGMTWNDRFL